MLCGLRTPRMSRKAFTGLKTRPDCHTHTDCRSSPIRDSAEASCGFETMESVGFAGVVRCGFLSTANPAQASRHNYQEALSCTSRLSPVCGDDQERHSDSASEALGGTCATGRAEQIL